MKKDRLVDLVTESDIVRMMTRVLGAKEKGKRINREASKDFGTIQGILGIPDKNKTIFLGMLTLPPEQEEEAWLVVLRLESEKPEPTAKELKSSGFTVSSVDEELL